MNTHQMARWKVVISLALATLNSALAGGGGTIPRHRPPGDARAIRPSARTQSVERLFGVTPTESEILLT